MKNSKELELLGEQLSKEYVEDGVDLTTNLKKQAQKTNLNPQQIKRVAESANVETYLKLAHLAEDGYVEFKLADAKVVTDQLSNSYDKAASELNIENPWKNLNNPNFKKAETLFEQEKVASDNSIISYHEVANNLAEIKLLETTVDFDYFNVLDKYAKVEHQVKQATAGGNEISDVKEVIKAASPHNKDILINDLTDNLKAGMPTQNFEKEAEQKDQEINKKSELYKAAENYEEAANILHNDVIELLNKKLEFGELVKESEYKYYLKEGMAKMKFLENLAKLNPFKTKTRAVLATGLVTLPLGVSLGKKEEQYKQQQRILMGKANG